MFNSRTRIIIVFVSFMLFCQQSNAQKEEDSKILITVDNAENLYTRLKDVLIRYNFYVKDLSIRDSLYTYPNEFNGVYIIAFAAINGNTVTLSGLYGLKKIDEWGYTNSPKNFNKIIYWKGNREWKRLNEIAILLGGNITYEK